MERERALERERVPPVRELERLRPKKSFIVRERVGKRKASPKRYTLHRNVQRDWREYGKGSTRSGVCPVGH